MAGDDPNILANAALALAYFGEDIGAMMALVDRPWRSTRTSRAGGTSAAPSGWAGQPDIAIEHMETSLRLSPRARVGTSLVTIGSSHFVSRRFDQAVPKLLLAIQEDPSHPLHIAISPPATPIWVGSTTHERLSRGCGPLPLS